MSHQLGPKWILYFTTPCTYVCHMIHTTHISRFSKQLLIIGMYNVFCEVWTVEVLRLKNKLTEIKDQTLFFFYVLQVYIYRKFCEYFVKHAVWQHG